MACLSQIRSGMWPIFMCYWTLRDKVEEEHWQYSCLRGERLVCEGVSPDLFSGGMLIPDKKCHIQVVLWDEHFRCYGFNSKQHSHTVMQVFMPYILELWVYKTHNYPQTMCTVEHEQAVFKWSRQVIASVEFVNVPVHMCVWASKMGAPHILPWFRLTSLVHLVVQ